MKLRLARPGTLVDVGRLADLSYVREDGDRIAIGALTRHKDVAGAAILQEHCGIVAHTAGPGRRSSGASPRDDRGLSRPRRSCLRSPHGRACARRRARRSRFGRRADDRRAGVLHRRLPDGASRPDELLVEIRVPQARSTRRVGRTRSISRRAQDWATVGGRRARATATTARWSTASIALTNMGGTPLRATRVEEAIAGRSLDCRSAAAHRGGRHASRRPITPASRGLPDATSRGSSRARALDEAARAEPQTVSRGRAPLRPAPPRRKRARWPRPAHRGYSSRCRPAREGSRCGDRSGERSSSTM